MATDEKLDDLKRDLTLIKGGIARLINRPLSVERSGLYLMMAITMFGTISTCSRTEEILNRHLKSPEIQTEKVLGEDAPEKFYWLNGQKVYLEIDGKPVERYVNDR